MTQESISGYKGKASDALMEAGCEIGDIIRITDKERLFEGILIPRSETNTDDYIVVKMKSGYNVGVKLTPYTSIDRIGKGIKPQFATPPIPEQNPNLPKVVIMSTGGTIASRVDYRTGAVRSALSASDLYGVVPELNDIARVETEIIFSLYSENITPQHWTEISQKVADKIHQGANGIVIAHGTDTMAYTAAALSFSLQNLPVPVILVGAQRSSDRPSSDAATNLIAAVNTAANAPYAEVTLAMHQTTSDATIAIHRGTRVRKCHTSRRDTFKSVNATPIAITNSEGAKQITMLVEDYQKRDLTKQLVLKPNFSDKVALIKFHPGLDPLTIDWYTERGFKGILLEGTGLGHVSKYCFDAIHRANENNVVVALASQCIWGRVNMNVYDTGRDLLNLGVIPLDDMFPETALVKLMWVLGQTSEVNEAKRLLKTNIAGELSPRTLFEETNVKGVENNGN
ncbi:MAG TPA: Glu-tRNA(Gln) amidotransferase subunit GatD [Candidatus Sulfotelmatobacter sp.]|nr:Glu-tRNA(Gln) amidotransferase subunit GatD [Candidatus Sulfotelmatobacter sp.]